MGRPKVNFGINCGVSTVDKNNKNNKDGANVCRSSCKSCHASTSLRKSLQVEITVSLNVFLEQTT